MLPNSLFQASNTLILKSKILQEKKKRRRRRRRPISLMSINAKFSSVQFSLSVVSDSLWPYGLQHARPPCPSPTQGVYSNSCPLSHWCHPIISSSVVPFPPTFNLSQNQGLFKWVSSSHQVAMVLEFQLQQQYFQWIFGTDFFRMDWLDLLAVQGTLKCLLQHHSSKASILQCSAFFIVQLSHPCMTTGKTIALTRWTFVGKVMSLHLICYLGWS